MSTQRTMSTTINTLMKQLKGISCINVDPYPTDISLSIENPVNWALIAILAYVIKSYASASKPAVQEAKHPEVMIFKNYTPLDLLPFDGLGKEGRILMAVNGSIYDVTRGKNFYGPGGPYANFAGHDASRGLAKNSFDADMLTDPNEPIDKLEDLAADEWESLREWEQHFASKYLFVGNSMETMASCYGNTTLLTPMDTAYIDSAMMPCRLLQLPDELQLKILAQLPVQDLLKSTVICRTWYHLIYNGSLWTTINTDPFYKTITMDQIARLLKASARFLKVANFRGCIQLTGHGLRTLSLSCPNLEVLNIKDCRGVSSASLGYFLQHADNLRVLNVSGLDTVKSSTLAHATCSKLERLEMSWCRNITGSGILALVRQSSWTLSYLKINGCPQLDDDTMALLGSSLPNLTHLSMAACTNLTDTALLSYLRSSITPPASSKHKLTHLNLSSCSRLTDATLLNLALYTQHIQHLELAGCVLMTDQGFCHLFARVHTFVHLDLEDVHQITTATIRSIANHQPHLQRLCISSCTQVSDDDVVYLVNNCNQLQHLELDNCTITDQVLVLIAHHVLQQQQQERKLSMEVLDCSNVTEMGVRKALAKASPFLSIKSFYSFQEEEQAQDGFNNDEHAMDNIHRQHGLGISGRYSALNSSRHRRGGGAHNNAHASANCIIL
ncbi:F-box/LRR-repeat protein 20 isoform X1 [Mucor ambiguus]|uniref:F-box/LRR-repeat protein 20 isoform X1 n=1 Tax=Mucor ambiguus TaxID=91626 RepID=A0A0C9MFG6_9FUNG|nr:F-box/LRR-repeat protein 20 isoform X1 [Mucor ambiguus]